MNSVVFLLGVFLIPLAMLMTCHRYRRLSRRQRRALWGLVIGYGIALIGVLLALLAPPILWTPDQPIRSFIIQWGLILMPALGVISGALLPRPAPA
jgi:hypothetical protein